MNYPQATLSGLCPPKAVDRPPTEIESELNEAQSVCLNLTDSVAKLESRLASVLTLPAEQPSNPTQPRPTLSPLAESIRKLTDQHRESVIRISRLLDLVQVPY